jgi:hypothetical protein
VAHRCSSSISSALSATSVGKLFAQAPILRRLVLSSYFSFVLPLQVLGLFVLAAWLFFVWCRSSGASSSATNVGVQMPCSLTKAVLAIGSRGQLLDFCFSLLARFYLEQPGRSVDRFCIYPEGKQHCPVIARHDSR